MTTVETLIAARPWFPGTANVVLLTVRLIAGGVMVYYGWGKVRDLRGTIKDFQDNIAQPGWLFGTLVTVTEFFGGLALILGIALSLSAAVIGFEMGFGTIVKKWKWGKDFPDYSYDILVLGLCLVLLAFGGGSFALGQLFL